MRIIVHRARSGIDNLRKKVHCVCKEPSDRWEITWLNGEANPLTGTKYKKKRIHQT